MYEYPSIIYEKYVWIFVHIPGAPKRLYVIAGYEICAVMQRFNKQHLTCPGRNRIQ